MQLRCLALLLSCATLSLLGADPQPISPELAGALRTSGLPATVESVVIPLESTFEGYIVVVNIDGKPVRLVLDTGSASTRLSPEVARKLGLQVKGGSESVTSAAGEQVVSRRALTKHLSLGDAWTENEPVRVSEMIPGID